MDRPTNSPPPQLRITNNTRPEWKQSKMKKRKKRENTKHNNPK